MRAVRGTDAGIDVVEVPEPSGEGVLVRVRSSGICASDIHMLAWGPSPVTLGHEIGGHLDDGTPVAVWPLAACGSCDRCRLGQPQQCRSLSGGVHGVGLDGGMADRLRVGRANIVPLPDGLTAADACLVEPVACSVHALRRARVAGDDRVAVVGAGSIGLGAAAVARWLGCRVDVAARHDGQAAAAVAMGAGTRPDGEYDVVVDGAGSSSSIARCFELLRPGGTVVLVSTPWEPVEFPAFFATGEPTVVTAMMHGPGGTEGGSDMEAAARLLAEMPEVPAALITHRFPLDRAREAFAASRDRAAGAIKVVLEP